MGHWRRRRAAAAISLVVGIALLNHPAGLQAAEVAENGLGAEQVPGEAGMARADLAAALRPLIQRLSLSLSHRELTILVLQLREARERAQAGGCCPHPDQPVATERTAAADPQRPVDDVHHAVLSRPDTALRPPPESYRAVQRGGWRGTGEAGPSPSGGDLPVLRKRLLTRISRSAAQGDEGVRHRTPHDHRAGAGGVLNTCSSISEEGAAVV